MSEPKTESTITDSNSLNDALLGFQIDKRSGVPIYLQISTFVLDLLDRIPFSPGTLLPAERIVCDRLGISKMTLRQAYSVLIQKGCLEAQRGVGTFVLGSRMEKKISGMLSFSEGVRARGGNPSSRVLSLGVRPASPEAGDFLKLQPGECAFEIVRLRYDNQLPLAIETVQLSQRLFPGLERFNWETESLYSVIEGRYRFKLARCHSEIMAVTAGREQASLLNVSVASPLLAINRKSYSNDGVPLEFTITYYPGNRYIATFAGLRDS
ncbi:MAG TPA: GntR family transcriptional regulator [Acidobacteriaceae bacterium]|nr:GntR family transcriptional regulator [Acidobacteriaceae bacterium]